MFDREWGSTCPQEGKKGIEGLGEHGEAHCIVDASTNSCCPCFASLPTGQTALGTEGAVERVPNPAGAIVVADTDDEENGGADEGSTQIGEEIIDEDDNTELGMLKAEPGCLCKSSNKGNNK